MPRRRKTRGRRGVPHLRHAAPPARGRPTAHAAAPQPSPAAAAPTAARPDRCTSRRLGTSPRPAALRHALRRASNQSGASDVPSGNAPSESGPRGPRRCETQAAYEELASDQHPGVGREGRRERRARHRRQASSEVRLALVALLCQGHLLIEDVPGTGKTVLAKAIAKSLGCSFRRIQFTPDLLPTDVTGLSIYNQKTQEFEFRPGPIMSQIVLADEINRATPKTQSALLESMEERHMTVDGTTYQMPVPFLVIATQNPIEYEGTFALPEAQLDRFMLRLRMGYPQPLEEVLILDEQKRAHPAGGHRGGGQRRRPGGDAGGRARDLRRPGRLRLHRPAGQLHAHPPRRLPRRLAARLAGALPRRPGLRRARRPRLRHPRTTSRSWPSPRSPTG